MTQRVDADQGRVRPAPKKRHPWRKTLIILLVLVGLLVAADFGLAAAAEYQVSKKLRSQLDLSDDPQVAIHGFPFITQALSADYQHITVDANGVHVGHTFRDLQVHADLYHVRVHLSDLLGGSVKSIPIDQVTGKLAVKADDIGRLINNTATGKRLGLSDLTIDPATDKQVLSSSEDSKDAQNNKSDAQKKAEQKAEDKYKSKAGVRFGTYVKLAGEKTWITAYGFITLVDGKIKVAPQRVKLSTDSGTFPLPQSIAKTLLQNFAITIDPGSLPFKARPLGIKVEPGAVAVQGVAKNVDINLGG
ncbi:MAG: LmeA family phospholipid-binding protein [Sciscionella sp.]